MIHLSGKLSGRGYVFVFVIDNVGGLVHLLHEVDEERKWCDLDKMNAAVRVREQNNNTIVLDIYTN